MLQERDTSLNGLLSSRHKILFLDYPQLEPFASLQMLHLQHTTVVIADRIEDAKHLTDRWSIQKKREVAEKVRRKLLDPEGGKVLMAEYKMKQEMQERSKEARKTEEVRRRAERAERKILEEANRAARRYRGKA